MNGILNPSIEKFAVIQASEINDNQRSIEDSVQLAINKTASIKSKFATIKGMSYKSTNKKWVHARNFLQNTTSTQRKSINDVIDSGRGDNVESDN